MRMTTMMHLGVAAMMAGALSQTGLAAVPAAPGVIPQELSDIESLGEASYDAALARQFATVANDAAAINNKWLAVRAQVQSDGSSDAPLVALDKAIADLQQASASSTDVVTVARAANAVSAPMDQLYALYNPKVPPAVLRLDYLGRQLAIDAMALDANLAKGHLAEVDTSWAGVKTPLLAAGGTAAAGDVDTTIGAIRRAVDAHDLATVGTQSSVFLDQVDAVEKVFER